LIMTHDHDAPVLRDLTPAFKWAVGFNAGYVLIEAAAGFATGSLALLADAAHNLTDVAGLLIAWGAMAAAKRPPSERFSYGFGRSTILAALANGVAILLGVGAVVWEAVQRFAEPVVVPAGTILIVALIGIAINAGTALLFRESRHSDLNAEGAFLHMAADAAVSLGVVLAAIGIMATGWTWLDPLVAILVSLVIAWTAYGLLRSALGLSLDAVPPGLDRAAVEAWLKERAGAASVHDLHIWPLSTTSVALTAHLVMPGGHPGDRFLEKITEELEHQFGIGHATIQIELGDAEECKLASTTVV
jgi:cobalt-zinc-cadmium efflux system protein